MDLRLEGRTVTVAERVVGEALLDLPGALGRPGAGDAPAELPELRHVVELARAVTEARLDEIALELELGVDQRLVVELVQLGERRRVAGLLAGRLLRACLGGSVPRCRFLLRPPLEYPVALAKRVTPAGRCRDRPQ